MCSGFFGDAVDSCILVLWYLLFSTIFSVGLDLPGSGYDSSPSWECACWFCNCGALCRSRGPSFTISQCCRGLFGHAQVGLPHNVAPSYGPFCNEKKRLCTWSSGPHWLIVSWIQWSWCASFWHSILWGEFSCVFWFSYKHALLLSFDALLDEYWCWSCVWESGYACWFILWSLDHIVVTFVLVFALISLRRY